MDRKTAAYTHGTTEYNNIIAQTHEESLSPIESVRMGLAQNLTSNMTWLKKKRVILNALQLNRLDV